MNDDRFPHRCPVCGCAAYLGGEGNVECTGAECRHRAADVRPLTGGVLGAAEDAGWLAPGQADALRRAALYPDVLKAEDGRAIGNPREVLEICFPRDRRLFRVGRVLGAVGERPAPDHIALSSGVAVERARDAYYNDTPEISDARYDELAADVRSVREWVAQRILELGPAELCSLARDLREDL